MELNAITEFFGNYTVQIVILGTLVLGLTSGALGSFALLRKQSLLGDAISHATLPGGDMPDADFEVVKQAAQLAGADEFIQGLAHGYDTVIGERGFSLSGGQRQRIAIARAIAADPRVLILDDATSAVDPTKEHEIRDALRDAMTARTTIVIAHRPATIALADRVVLLAEGRVAASGTHAELVDTSELYRQVLAQGAIDDSTVAGGG